jgi:prepilin-type N-terminal cleavage/methylation domain-containing protein
MRKRSQTGFSALELLIVVSIGLVLMAMVAPLVSTALNMYRLRGAAGDYVTLLQSARMRAVTSDRYLPVNIVFGAQAPNAPNPFNAYVDLNGDGAYNAGEPAVAFNPLIAIRPDNTAPNPQNLYQQFLPNTAANQVVINPTAWGPTFGSRGLPCQAAARAGVNCSYTSNPAGLPLAFETFMQNIQTGMWEAVTVNPAGRIRQWHYDITQNTWQPLN